MESHPCGCLVACTFQGQPSWREYGTALTLILLGQEYSFSLSSYIFHRHSRMGSICEFSKLKKKKLLKSKVYGAWLNLKRYKFNTPFFLVLFFFRKYTFQHLFFPDYRINIPILESSERHSWCFLASFSPGAVLAGFGLGRSG